MLINNKGIVMPTEKEKEEKWRKLCYSWAEEAEENYKIDNKKVASLMALELTGGKCPKCGIEWKQVKFDNMLASGEYFVPACTCYYKCPRCENSLHLDDAAGKLADNEYCCTNCEYPLNGLAEDEYLKRTKNEFSRKWLKKYFDGYRK